MVGLNFLVISIFCLYGALYKIHTWKLLTYENIFAHAKKSIAEEIPRWKNKKKYRPKEERKSTILSRKEKKFFVEATVELHAGVQISNKELAVKSKLLNMLRRIQDFEKGGSNKWAAKGVPIWGWSGGMLPLEILKFKSSELRFPALWGMMVDDSEQVSVRIKHLGK